MRTLVHLRNRTIAAQELVTLAAALFLAEMFYKFHSFILEAVAFLATWYLLSSLAEWIRGNHRRKGEI